jgi:hypothetical protein
LKLYLRCEEGRKREKKTKKYNYKMALVLGLGREGDVFEDFIRIKLSKLFGDDSGHF